MHRDMYIYIYIHVFCDRNVFENIYILPLYPHILSFLVRIITYCILFRSGNTHLLIPWQYSQWKALAFHNAILVNYFPPHIFELSVYTPTAQEYNL